MATMEIAIILFAIMWFFTKLWEGFNQAGIGKHVRVFFMMIAFIHAIGLLFIAFTYAGSGNITNIQTYIRIFLYIDSVLLVITVIILLIGWTDKGKSAIMSLVKKFRR